MPIVYNNKSFIEKLLIGCFSLSLALGTFNPLYMNSVDEGGIGLGQILIVILVPYLFMQYKGSIFVSLEFRNWQKPLCWFFMLSFLCSLVMSKGWSTEFLMMWVKLLFAIEICLLLPISFRRNENLNMSILLFTIGCVILSVLIIAGVLGSYVTIHNGRMWCWGENPNSTSTRWGMAVMFIIYIIMDNPFKWSKIRYGLLLGVIPLFILIIWSGSRGSFLITLLSIGVSYFRYAKRSIMQSIVLLLIVLIPALNIISNQLSNSDFALFDRLKTAADEGGDQYRSILLRSAIDMFASSPIWGVGSSNFMDIMISKYHNYNTVHNMYAYILAISGLLGFIPFAIFMYRVIRGTLSIVKMNSFPLLVLLFMMFIASKTGGILTYLFMWYIYAVVISYVDLELSKRKI